MLPDYLWGIETVVLGILSCARIRFQTTYEELKLGGVLVVVILLASASRLPMRNWNSQNSKQQYELCQASRLPMRNWNPNKSPIVSMFASCFQTTYEELKPVSIPRFAFEIQLPDYLWGIETFVLASISGFWVRLPDYLWGIETLSLPGVILRWCTPLPDYLWGIETATLSRVAAFSCKLPDYLWGIETRLYPQKSGRNDRFQTTYEELKHSQQEIQLSIERASRLPMRNWN